VRRCKCPKVSDWAADLEASLSQDAKGVIGRKRQRGGTNQFWSGAGVVTAGNVTVYVGPAKFLSDNRDHLLSYETRTGRCWLGTVGFDTLEWLEVGRLPFQPGARLPGAWVGWFRNPPGSISMQSLILYDADRRDWWYGFFHQPQSPLGGPEVVWKQLGNTAGFGDLLDGRHLIFCGRIDASYQDSILFNYVADGNWFHGTGISDRLDWQLVGNTRGFGDLADSKHLFRQGYFPWDDPRGRYWSGSFSTTLWMETGGC
jgi:hypothetical protein